MCRKAKRETAKAERVSHTKGVHNGQRETATAERVSHTKGVHNGRDAKPAKAEKPRKATRYVQKSHGKPRATCRNHGKPRATCRKVARRTRETRSANRHATCGDVSHAVAIEATEGTCKEHMSHAAPDKDREKAEQRTERTKAIEP